MKEHIIQTMLQIRCHRCKSLMVFGVTSKGIYAIYCGNQFCENSESIMNVKEEKQYERISVYDVNKVPPYTDVVNEYREFLPDSKSVVAYKKVNKSISFMDEFYKILGNIRQAFLELETTDYILGNFEVIVQCIQYIERNTGFIERCKAAKINIRGE